MLRLEEEDIYAGIATSGSGGGGDTPESAKGSFNASTQQLTLKYDYLVEKINSSDQLTAETKEFIIGRLNNSDVVVDMTRDTISTTGHSSDIAWACSDGDPTSENPDEFPTTMIFVSKSNPETIKFIIPADSGGLAFGSYNSMRALYEMQGQSLTAEEVEALLSSSVVDEEVFTISGTLGNFEVEFIEDGPVVEKYGATISNFLGDVDSNGVLQAPSEDCNIVFNGVENVGELALIYAFGLGSNGTRVRAKTIQFPDLTAVSGAGAMQYMCHYSSTLSSGSFPKLVTISGTNAMQSVFANCTNLTSASFPELTTISGIQSLSSAFYGCTKLTSLSFPKLTTISGSYGMSSAMSSCTGLTSVDLSALETIEGQGAQYMFNGCTSLTSVSFPRLKKVGNTCLINAFQNCTSLTSLSFPALTSKSFVTVPRAYCFNDMLKRVTGCTVHFPSNLEALIGSEVYVTNGFGGTNTTVLFDLPATE